MVIGKGAVLYRDGEFEKAARILKSIDLPFAKVLRALSLAQIAGREQEALQVFLPLL